MYTVRIYSINLLNIKKEGGAVADFFFESLAIQRIELVARLVANGRCSSNDRELALSWISEMTTTLAADVDRQLQKRPQDGGVNSGSGGSALQ